MDGGRVVAVGGFAHESRGGSRIGDIAPEVRLLRPEDLQEGYGYLIESLHAKAASLFPLAFRPRTVKSAHLDQNYDQPIQQPRRTGRGRLVGRLRRTRQPIDGFAILRWKSMIRGLGLGSSVASVAVLVSAAAFPQTSHVDTNRGELLVPRYGPTAVSDGTWVYVYGGSPRGARNGPDFMHDGLLSLIERIDPISLTSEYFSNGLHRRANHGSAFADGSIVSCGGRTQVGLSRGRVSSCESLDLESGTFRLKFWPVFWSWRAGRH